MNRAAHRYGFTLIELLVVVTIIVVLLALLVPALDKAIYTAQLSVCGAQQRTMGSGATHYAMENKRAYFHRPGVFAHSDVSWRTFTMREPVNATFDDRIVTRGYIPLSAFADPLCGNVDMSESGTEDDVTIVSSYNLLFGYKFNAQGMTRLGNRLTWRGKSFNLLTADLQYYDRNAAGVVNLSHPDKDGAASLTEMQNWDTVLGLYGRYTGTFWANNAAMTHGDVDMNYGYQDLSVRRIDHLPAVPNDVIYNPVNPGDYPLRMIPFISKDQGTSDDQVIQVWLPEGS